jgi:hypothetical protein
VKDFLVWLHPVSPEPLNQAGWDSLIDSISGAGAANERTLPDLIQDAGLALPVRHHYGLPEEGTPIVEIDFQVSNIHVLVDGSIHHSVWMQQINQSKRGSLRHEGYTVLAFHTQDTASGIQRHRALL